MQISLKEAAVLLDVSESVLYRWINNYEIPFHKINESYLFNRAELLQWATSRGIKVSPDMFIEPDEESCELPKLSEALITGGVLYDIEGETKAEVIKSIVDKMKLPPEVDRQYLFQILVAREALGSTGIGNGIAVPHVRNPLVLNVAVSEVTLCFLKTPIDFNAIDGKPVSILFTIISPTVRCHLHLLSRIAYVLRDTVVMKSLHNRSKPEEIMNMLTLAESRIPKVSK